METALKRADTVLQTGVFGSYKFTESDDAETDGLKHQGRHGVITTLP